VASRRRDESGQRDDPDDQDSRRGLVAGLAVRRHVRGQQPLQGSRYRTDIAIRNDAADVRRRQLSGSSQRGQPNRSCGRAAFRSVSTASIARGPVKSAHCGRCTATRCCRMPTSRRSPPRTRRATGRSTPARPERTSCRGDDDLSRGEVTETTWRWQFGGNQLEPSPQPLAAHRE
jgi:hypothetical protein